MIDWNKGKADEHRKAGKIAKRAAGLTGGVQMTFVMDLMACHTSGCKLDLDKLAKADDFNLLHDVCGINRHLDRETGKLQHCFLPRFAA